MTVRQSTWTNKRPSISSFAYPVDDKMDRDEVLVKLVEHESIIWKRNHPQFKNITAKEQAWGRVAFQLGITCESFQLFANVYMAPNKKKFIIIPLCITIRRLQHLPNLIMMISC